MNIYRVIGIMSGTSLDGVDIAYCEFSFDQMWNFNIIVAETFEYPDEWVGRLSGLMKTDALQLSRTHVDYGKYLGKITKDFILKNNCSPQFISSHGHTIFHQPGKGYTLQIGDGNSISAITGLPVIFDFRSLDVALGGQGAPLVPVGDRLLFGNFDYCLNLGGISNISFENKDKRIAFDICPVNIVLNLLANKKGLKFDAAGELASRGEINIPLLNSLSHLGFYHLKPPKSLGREWIDHEVVPIIEADRNTPENKLRTFTEHIAIQIAETLTALPAGKLLITGGGAKNLYLVERIKEKVENQVFLPDDIIIDYKEAMIFSFLGVLRWRNEINCLSSVTGAIRDSCTGVIVNGTQKHLS